MAVKDDGFETMAPGPAKSDSAGGGHTRAAPLGQQQGQRESRHVSTGGRAPAGQSQSAAPSLAVGRARRNAGRNAAGGSADELVDEAAGDAAGNGGACTPAARRGPSLKNRAIGYLSRREHSRLELQRKLAPHTDDPDALEQLLDDLEREKWLSNDRFAQSLVNRRAGREGAGRIVQALRQHGVGDDKVAEISASLRDTEAERAREVWQKKFGELPADAREYARQYRFLASRGFSTEHIRRILGDIPYGG